MDEKRYQELINNAINSDPDQRYMMANDLTEAIEREQIKDTGKVQQSVQLILKQLEDEKDEVTNNALRCISRLIKRLGEGEVGHIATYLIQKLIDIPDCHGLWKMQDMFASCLKSVIKEVPHTITGVLLNIFELALKGLDRDEARLKD